MNQRLFKRLILYYNVSIRQITQTGKIFTKADSAPSGVPDDSRKALNQATRASSHRRRDPSAAFPFDMAEAGTGPLAMLTDVSRNLYPA